MKTISKKFTAVILSAVMLVTGLFFVPAKSEAAEYDYLLDQYGQAEAGQDITYDYTVKKAGYLYNYLTAVSLTGEKTGVNITVYKAGENVYTKYISSTDTDWTYNEKYQAYDYILALPYASAGDYQIKFNFDNSAIFLETIMQPKATPVISNKSVVITKGFTKKLSVKDAGGKVTWSSSKKSVATVDKNGKVTAKKKGTATISAKTADGTLKCKVTVKDNVYTASKPVVSEVSYGKSVLSVYKMSYDKSGNLIIKCRFVNNRGYKAVALENFAVTAKSQTGKTMGKVSVKRMKVSVPTGSTKDITLKIKKSKLKVKKADLRNSTYSMKTGTAVYETGYCAGSN